VPTTMELLSKLLLHLVWDTFVLFLILRVSISAPSRSWKSIGTVALGMAVCKAALFLMFRELAVLPVFLAYGLYLRWAYTLTTRQIVYILGTFLFASIVFGAVREMAYGVLRLFFL
jgi:hypothetical protein